jgi:hypothetical protein
VVISAILVQTCKGDQLLRFYMQLHSPSYATTLIASVALSQLVYTGHGLEA